MQKNVMLNVMSTVRCIEWDICLAANIIRLHIRRSIVMSLEALDWASVGIIRAYKAFALANHAIDFLRQEKYCLTT